jgi:ABC-type cobalamin/Fe3+-siderophores transport system ATPase subunit
LREISTELSLLQGEIRQLEETKTDAIRAREKLVEMQKTEREARELLLALSDYIKESDPTKAMTTVVTDVLKKLFSDDIVSFNIETVEKRNQLETYFTITRKYGKGKVTQPIMVTSGGGLIDVVFMMIRIILLVNHPSKSRRVLFADEPMKNLSIEKRGMFMDLLRQICKEFDIQIVMTTHEQEYIESADQVFRFSLEGGETHAEEVLGVDGIRPV